MSVQVVIFIGLQDDDAQGMCQSFAEDGLVQTLICPQAEDAAPLLARELPELILIDVDNLQREGVMGLLQQIRHESIIVYRPVIIIQTTSDSEDERIQWLISGADDLLAMPLSTEERRIRIFAHLRRSLEQLSHPVTHLPGPELVRRVLQRKMNRQEEWALMAIGLDQFDVYVDTYGYLASDQVVRTLGALLYNLIRQPDVVGHWETDTFVVITHPDKVEKLANLTCRQFDTVVPNFYSEQDKKRGYVVAVMENQASQRVRLMSLSIGIVSNAHRGYSNYKEAFAMVQEMKALARLTPTSTWVSDRLKLSAPGDSSPEGKPLSTLQDYIHEVLVIESDAAFAFLLKSTLEMQGYEVDTLGSIQEAHQWLEDGSLPQIIIMDSLLNGQLVGLPFCQTVKEHFPQSQVIMMATIHDREGALSAGADLYIPKPFDLMTLFHWVDRLSGRSPGILPHGT